MLDLAWKTVSYEFIPSNKERFYQMRKLLVCMLEVISL